jgi:diguanylate cyclase (GGDEF)-like protein
MKALATIPDVSAHRPRARLAVWTFLPAFLILHGIVATCLPSRFDPLSTILIVLAEWIAIASCLRNARIADSSTRAFWLLLSGAIFIHSLAMALDAVTEIAQIQGLNHVPAIQVLLSMLSGVLFLVTVSIQNDRGIRLVARSIHAVLSVAIGAAIYFQIFRLLTIQGGPSPSNELLVTHLFDALDVYLAIAATIRWLGSGHDHERRFFRMLTFFLWIDAALPAVHNRILMHHDWVWLDLLISAPYVALVPLAADVRNRPAVPASRTMVRVVKSGSPIFLAAALALTGVFTARSNLYLGLAETALAIVGYGILNVFVLSRGLETEERLQELVDRDGLTGIANRRAFDETLQREVALARRAMRPVSLLMMDADLFKQLNDADGHMAGDECLVHIATELRARLPRVTDFVARYGGEEFAVILPATDAAGAVNVAGVLRAGVAALGLRHPTSPFGRVTVSIGVSTFEGTESLSAADLIRSADRALYAAKRAGRNRSEFHPMTQVRGSYSVSRSL